MESVVKMIHPTEKTLSDVELDNKQSLIKEIKEVCRQLESTDRWFQMENDEDLIEACIYKREFLNARYRYLMRKAKSENLYSSPFEKKCL